MTKLARRVVHDIYAMGQRGTPMKDVEAKYCATCLDEYIGCVLVYMEYSNPHASSWSDTVLLPEEDHARLEAWNASICLGEIGGKHSEVFVNYGDLITRVETDPEAIALAADEIGFSENPSYLELPRQHVRDAEEAKEAKEAKRQKRKRG